MTIKTLAIVGCGKLATIITDALIEGFLPDYQLIGAFSRTVEKAKHIADKVQNAESGYTCATCNSLDELLALKPDYIIETASPDSMKALALPALRNGSSIVTLSIGAFADTEFYAEVKATARENNTRVHLVSGAIGGFDVLRTVSLMGDCTATFHTEKGPNSLKNTAVYEESLQTEKRKVFEGNAQEAIALFPTRVNVAVAASLASVGPENMKVSMTSTPGFTGDEHRIEVKSDQVHAVIDVYSATAQIAGWSVVNTLRNITSPIVF
ncbi:aspartate dehydrogenase [Arcticibacter pallidicorallinus]|uniref:L-aspartate dehydrogenase n=1 Tax=Arcticibacter pallidicorallinus TaxID=1259464 RepID=A0A2T0U4D6_9SPHI|nr:aspartate dehydrogenase domain-containing protein [Arcticibacter pallidicorallinus]PRY52781.1 aspartate dehydrogenase [Arcticibacter pallidicorallinus]